MRNTVRTGALAATTLVVAAGCGAGRPTTVTDQSAETSASNPQAPTLSQFANDPSCYVYNSATSIRLRIRAPNAALACALLPQRFPASSRLSFTTHRPPDFRTSGGNRRYATLCRLAAPGAKYELEINAATGALTPGHLLCAEAAGTRGWFDLDKRLTAFDVGGRSHRKGLIHVYFCTTVSMSGCGPSATRAEERRARRRLEQEPCVRQVVFVSKAVGRWLLEKETGIPPISPNPLPDALVIVSKEPSCAAHIATAAGTAHLAGVQTVKYSP
jgi:hypothetical protein